MLEKEIFLLVSQLVQCIEYAKKKEDIRLLTPDFYNFAGFDIVDFYPVPHFNAYIFEYVTLQIMQKI